MGRLLGFTTVQAPPTGVAKPLYLGLVEFEGGVRILGRLVAPPAGVDAHVRPVFGPLREKLGKVYAGYAFELMATS